MREKKKKSEQRKADRSKIGGGGGGEGGDKKALLCRVRNSFSCAWLKRGESESVRAFSSSFSLSPFQPFSLPLSPAAQFIVAAFDSCDHLRLRETGGGEEARGGERELVSTLGVGSTAGRWRCVCVCVWGNVYMEDCVCT